MITEDRMERALQFLAETDDEFAQWRGQVLRSEFSAECAESLAFKALEGGVEEKKRALKLLPEVQTAWENHFKAVVGFENCKARRARAVLTIEVWRSLNSARTKGIIQ